MAQKNQDIHLFIIEESYSQGKAKQVFETTASALHYIFAAKPN